MAYKIGDRFINTVTGTIIEITWMGMVEVLLEVWYDENTEYHERWDRQYHMELTNINDSTKVKRIPTYQMDVFLEYSNGKILPYNGERHKPIEYIKQHKLITT
jgi:hypothetical protein